MCLFFLIFLGTKILVYLTVFEILRRTDLDVPNFFGY